MRNCTCYLNSTTRAIQSEMKMYVCMHSDEIYLNFIPIQTTSCLPSFSMFCGALALAAYPIFIPRPVSMRNAKHFILYHSIYLAIILCLFCFIQSLSVARLLAPILVTCVCVSRWCMHQSYVVCMLHSIVHFISEHHFILFFVVCWTDPFFNNRFILLTGSYTTCTRQQQIQRYHSYTTAAANAYGIHGINEMVSSFLSFVRSFFLSSSFSSFVLSI